jgi:hypothetical protein
MNDANTKPCPDCDGTMRAIRMLDKTIVHHSMDYSVPDAERSFWTSKFPVHGSVNALMCDACGFIKLYGGPKVDY